MSRIGRKPINIPAGVDVKVSDGVVTVKGPKATLTQKVHPNMTVKVEGSEVLVTRPNDEKLDPHPDPQYDRGRYRGLQEGAGG